MKSWISAERQAEWRSESVIEEASTPRRIFSRIVASNREDSWATSEMDLRYSFTSSSLISRSWRRILPV